MYSTDKKHIKLINSFCKLIFSVHLLYVCFLIRRRKELIGEVFKVKKHNEDSCCDWIIGHAKHRGLCLLVLQSGKRRAVDIYIYMPSFSLAYSYHMLLILIKITHKRLHFSGSSLPFPIALISDQTVPLVLLVYKDSR